MEGRPSLRERVKDEGGKRGGSGGLVGAPAGVLPVSAEEPKETKGR